MKNKYHYFFFVVLTMLIFHTVRAQETTTHIPDIIVQGKKTKTIIYTQLNIHPNIEEVKTITENIFFNTLDFIKDNDIAIIQSSSYINFEEDLQSQISELCENNNADFVVIPSIRFFKVGFGKYIFSSQVVVTLNLYNAEGKLISSNAYDTLKRKGRIFGSAENSIRKGTIGAYEMMKKSLKQ